MVAEPRAASMPKRRVKIRKGAEMKNKMLLFIASGVVMAALATVGIASTVGYGYFVGLRIGLDRQNPTMTVSSAGAVVATSVSMTGAAQSAGVVSTSYLRLASKTKAQIVAIVPGAAGDLYYCSDCTAAASKVVVSTGITVGAFALLTSSVTAPS